MAVVKRLKLSIPTKLVNEPIVYKIVTQFQVQPNIIEAQIDPESLGQVVLELKGAAEKIDESINYLKNLEIKVTEL